MTHTLHDALPYFFSALLAIGTYEGLNCLRRHYGRRVANTVAVVVFTACAVALVFA